MTCVAPGDAAGLDAMLARAGSPLAGEGATFVPGRRAGSTRARWWRSRRTRPCSRPTSRRRRSATRSASAPAWPSPARATPSRSPPARWPRYLPEGRDTLATIGAKWAPLGAANDPGGLNANWTAGVGAYYAALGGDPARPIRAGARPPARPAPAAPPLAVPLPPAEPTGPPVVTAWGGAVPRGAGAPAVIDGFVFPLALPLGAPAIYGDSSASRPGLRRSPAPVRGHDRDLPGRAPWPRPPGPCGARRPPTGRRGSRSGSRPRGATGWATAPWSRTRRGWARARRSRPDSPSASTRGCCGWRGPAAGEPRTLPAAGGHPPAGLTRVARRTARLLDRLGRRADEEARP